MRRSSAKMGGSENQKQYQRRASVRMGCRGRLYQQQRRGSVRLGGGGHQQNEGQQRSKEGNDTELDFGREKE